jgi:hypothetical protein
MLNGASTRPGLRPMITLLLGAGLTVTGFAAATPALANDQAPAAVSHVSNSVAMQLLPNTHLK